MKATFARDIVVMGGSAGSSQALVRILSALPANFAATIVACVDAPVALNEALSSREPAWLQTRLPCRHAQEGTKLIVGTVFLLPSDVGGSISSGGLVSLKKMTDAEGAPSRIDALFSSAAAAFGRRLIGVVLSGDNDDGTEGLKTIESHGGLGIVQSPVDALQTRAPSHAVYANHPDRVAMLDEIPRLLMQWTHSS